MVTNTAMHGYRHKAAEHRQKKKEKNIRPGAEENPLLRRPLLHPAPAE
jgi:hypothetical protein